MMCTCVCVYIHICTCEYGLQLQASWRNIGQGYCRDTAGTNPWSWESFCTSLSECKSKCTNCAGITWAEVPSEDHDGCQSDGLSRCNVYNGNGIATRTSYHAQEYTCYAIVQEAELHFCQITFRHITSINFHRYRVYIFTRLTIVYLRACNHYYLVCYIGSRI